LRIEKRSHKILIAVLVCMLAVAGWAWSVWVRIYEETSPLPGTVEDPGEQPLETEKHITNILILGTDQIKHEAARADTIMVLSFNEDTEEVALISIPRDARVEIPNRGMDKINHAMAYKGEIVLMISTVEKLLDIPIHHYVYTNFRGFSSMVDILGGVTINVEKEMIHDDEDEPFPFRLSPGLRKLNGEEALGYVRFRGDDEGDFGRIRRQQVFLNAVAKETLKLSTVLKLPQLLEQAAKYIRTDMTITELLSFSRTATGIDPDDIVMITLQGKTTNFNGVSYVALDSEFMEETVRRYLRWEDI
jgi:polyisoprenyl-teichoic acid--peptidoglycan teichoic acid transferase